tara:strand:- start:458 stop:769 length:312 start_codon:yes stop_codon:yes gene_type:complete
MKNIKLFEEFINEKVNADELVKGLEKEFSWNQGSAEEMTISPNFAFRRGAKDDKNIFITYSGMKGQSIAKDIRNFIKDSGAKVVQVEKENGDNEHYYHIEIKR